MDYRDIQSDPLLVARGEAMLTRRSLICSASAFTAAITLPGLLRAQNQRLRVITTQGVIEPLPFAIPSFIARNGAAADAAADITRVIAADLRGTGLFRQIPDSAHISSVTNFDAPILYPVWWAIIAQA